MQLTFNLPTNDFFFSQGIQIKKKQKNFLVGGGGVGRGEWGLGGGIDGWSDEA